jgi:acetyl-CoA carboxylase biotin carboxyl carrier protein
VARKSDTPGTPAIDHEAIRELAKLLDETGLTEIAVERDGAAAPTTVAATPLPVDPAQHPGVVASPMVGTAYLAPEPGARPFVEVGTLVKTGEPLMIIEAMKTMNQIPAPRAGTVIQILVDDGQPVEYGQPLMIIE